MSGALFSGIHRRYLARAVAAAFLALLAGCNFSGRPETEETPRAPAPSVAEAAPAAGTPGPGTYSAFPGDTVYGVAQRFGVPVRTLIETNGLKPPYRLVAGQRLQVPVRQEHIVQAGDTLLAISRIYGVDQSSLVRENGLVPPYAIKPGQRLTLPGRIEANLAEMPPEQQSFVAPTSPNATTGGSMSVEELPPTTAPQAPKQQPPKQQAATQPATVPPTPETTAPSTPDTTPPMEEPTAPEASAPAVPQASPPKTTAPKQTEMAAIPPEPEPEPAPRGSERFLWPVKGKVISSFGPKKGGFNNDGINIAAPEGATVVAADNGVVAYAGNELRGFGNLLLIRHADGWVTAYAHNEKLLVKRGERVKRGQAIAQIGSTGSVSAPQLHFEVRKGTDPVDPLKYLGS
jgi:murein DD-endopeptidase MepM/ murein hydrolase activator NlpD